MAMLALSAILMYCSFFGQFAKPDLPKQEQEDKDATERAAMEKLMTQLVQRLSPEGQGSEPGSYGEARMTIVDPPERDNKQSKA
jgi:hypothetical protein